MKKINRNYYLGILFASVLALTGCTTDTVSKELWEDKAGAIEVVEAEPAGEESEEEAAARLEREEKIAQAEIEAKNVRAISELVMVDDIGEIKIASTSRKNIAIPAYIYFPKNYKEEDTYPLVIMFSGFAGDHSNGTRFNDIAESISSENNTFVVMYDYPGYGSSEETNLEYTITNMEKDAKDVLNYMKKNYNISKVGAFGYDVGGRIVMEMVVDGTATFDQIELVAPYSTTEDFINACFGDENWNDLWAKADTYGSVQYGEQLYSKEWFEDWDEYDGTLTELFISKYKGNPSMVVFSTDDQQITLYNMELLTKGLGSASVCVTSGGHSLGVEGYETPKDVERIVEDQSIAFMNRLYDGIYN